MKIVFTGGGTAGHFYPIIAVVEALNVIARERKLVNLKYYFLSDNLYDERALFENHIEFRRVRAGRLRRYFSLRIIPDFFQGSIGIIEAIFKLYEIYPDLVFCKGGYASFPWSWRHACFGFQSLSMNLILVPGGLTISRLVAPFELPSATRKRRAFSPKRNGR